MTPFKMFILTVLIQGSSARDHSLIVERFENPCYVTEKGMTGTTIIDRANDIRIVTKSKCVPDNGSPPPILELDPEDLAPPVVRKGYPTEPPYRPRPRTGDPILDFLPGR